MIGKYRKKPVIIEAVQWSGYNLKEVMDFAGEKCRFTWVDIEKCEEEVRRGGLKISTLEGLLDVSIEDFIIKGVQGEFYPCKPDIFAETYEREESSSKAASSTTGDRPWDLW